MENTQCNITISKFPGGAYEAEGQYSTGESVKMILGKFEDACHLVVTALRMGARTATVAIKVDSADAVEDLMQARNQAIEAYEAFAQQLQNVHRIYVEDAGLTSKQASHFLGFSTSAGYKNNTVDRFLNFIGDEPAIVDNSSAIIGEWSLDDAGYLSAVEVSDKKLEKAVADQWVLTGGLLAISEKAEDPQDFETEEESVEASDVEVENAAEEEVSTSDEYGYSSGE